MMHNIVVDDDLQILSDSQKMNMKKGINDINIEKNEEPKTASTLSSNESQDISEEGKSTELVYEDQNLRTMAVIGTEFSDKNSVSSHEQTENLKFNSKDSELELLDSKSSKIETTKIKTVAEGNISVMSPGNEKRNSKNNNENKDNNSINKKLMKDKTKTKIKLEKKYLDKLNSKNGAEELNLYQLKKIEENLCKNGFKEDDSVYILLNKFIKSRIKKKRVPLKEMLEGGSQPRSVRDWVNFVSKCEKELPKNDEILVNAQKKLNSRKESHLNPILNVLKEINKGDVKNSAITLRALKQLHRRAISELPLGDPIFSEIENATKSREDSHKKKLIKQYSKIMKGGLIEISVKQLNEFVKACEFELDPDDSLIAQARSACDAKILNKTDPNKAKIIGTSREKKKKDKDDKNGKTKKYNKTESDDIVLNIKEDNDWGNSKPSWVPPSIAALLVEFSGKNDSLTFKVIFLITFVMFTYIMLTYMHLMVQVVPIKIFKIFEKNTPQKILEEPMTSEGSSEMMSGADSI